MLPYNRISQLISAYLVLQTIAFVSAQPVTTRTANTNISDTSNLPVTTPIQDYILKKQLEYNGTLEGFINQINNVKESLEDQLVGFEKLKTIVVNTIDDTNKNLMPLELVNLETKYCIQKYKAELPYGPIVKAGIEACIEGARDQAKPILNEAITAHNNLYNFYYVDLTKQLYSCKQKNINSTSSYTVCVENAIAKANTYTNVNRKDFANAIKMSTIKLNERINATATCTFNYQSDALKSIGAATRLIHDCIDGFLENRTPEPCLIQNNTTTSTQNNTTIHSPLEELDVRKELDKETSYSAARNYSAT